MGVLSEENKLGEKEGAEKDVKEGHAGVGGGGGQASVNCQHFSVFSFAPKGLRQKPVVLEQSEMAKKKEARSDGHSRLSLVEVIAAAATQGPGAVDVF